MQQATQHAGLMELDYVRAFPEGVSDVVRFFLREIDQKMLDFAANFEENSKISAKIRHLILKRLHHCLPHREAIRKAIGFLALPQHADIGLRSLYQTVDQMWRIAGDHPTDFSFYTKRLSLAAIYSATVLFWLDDPSENQQGTAAFLDRRLNNIRQLGQVRQRFATFTFPFPFRTPRTPSPPTH